MQYQTLLQKTRRHDAWLPGSSAVAHYQASITHALWRLQILERYLPKSLWVALLLPLLYLALDLLSHELQNPPKDKKGELRVLQQGMHIFQEISAILYSH